MPNNPFGIWSEAVDGRHQKIKQKDPLTPAEMHIIKRIISGDTSNGINLHKLKGAHPTVYSAYANDTDRLLFITNGATLVLIGKTPHQYNTTHALQPGVAERIYQKPWDEIKDNPMEYEVIASLDDFIPTPDYEYQPPESCSSYHYKFITLDDTQQSTFQLKTPGVIIGDPGCGKSTLCSIMMEEDLNNPAFLDEGRFIAYFTQSKGLPEKMQQAWILDHPVTARQPEANQLRFINYADVLSEFAPPEIQGKEMVGKPAFQKTMKARLTNKNLMQQYPFIKSEAFKKLSHTLYHEFQIIVGCKNPDDYLTGNINANLPREWRTWAYKECLHYIDNLRKEGKCYDPNLLLWEPTHQPFSRVYHDEALSAAPVVNRMLQRLTNHGDVIYFADPNQQEKDAFSNLPIILNLISENNQPPSMMKLDVTYRLPPTIAHVANDLLKIKQNINQGKNEPHQSDAVICKPEEHVYPGSLEWIQLEQAEAFVRTLNESNRVYVVITHPEYLEDARKLFGDRVYICSIEEARGQEFDEAVLFQVTNPKNQADKNGHQRREATALQQINRLLAPMEAELKNKPNLPKAGKANHDFEAYINHIYIALSRVVKHGYFIEAGDPHKNELHKRLTMSITKAMEHVSTDQPKAPMSLEAILENAKQDLRAGRVMQAKAGFLKAGKTEADVEALQKAQDAENVALMESILKARNATQPTQLTQPIKSDRQPSASRKKRTKNRKSPPKPTAPSAPTRAPEPAPVLARIDTTDGKASTYVVLYNLETLERANTLFKVNDSNQMLIMEVLDDNTCKESLLNILNHPNNPMHKAAVMNFKVALFNCKMDAMITITEKNGGTHEIPFIFYLFNFHFDLIDLFNVLCINKLKTLIKNPVFAKPYRSSPFETDLNLITLISYTNGAILAELFTENPALIGSVDWTLVLTKNHFAPVSALGSLIGQTDHIFNKIHALLKTHQAIFLKQVSIEDLFKHIPTNQSSLKHHTTYDSLSFSQNGLQLLNIIAEKLTQDQSFDDIFTDDFLSHHISLCHRKTEQEYIYPHPRLKLISKIPLLATKCIESRADCAGFVKNLIQTSPSSDLDIRDFNWSSFSNLLSRFIDNPIVLTTLIETRPASLKNLPESIWHAPIMEKSELGFKKDNYLLMHLIIRRYGGTVIEAFFKEHYPEAYQAATNTMTKTLETPNEVIEKLDAVQVIEEESVEVLAHHLLDSSTYQWYATPYKNGDSILWYIVSSEKLRAAFLKYFLDLAEAGQSLPFLYFMQKNDINQLVNVSVKSTTTPITLPLICVLFQDTMGRTLIERCIEYAPHALFNSITMASLTKTYPLLDDAANKPSSLLYHLADKHIKLFSKLCEYSALISDIPFDFFSERNAGTPLSIITRLSLPFMTNKPNEETCLLYVEALCNLLEGVSLQEKDNSLLDHDKEKQFITILLLTTPSYVNRYLNALGRNPALLNGVLQRNNQLKKPSASTELEQRRYRVHGLSNDEKHDYTRILNNEDLSMLDELLANPLAPYILSQSLGEDRPGPLFLYFFESNLLRKSFIDTVNSLLTIDHNHPIALIFTKAALSYYVFSNEARVPLLFELMQNNDRYQLITTLEKIQPDFYARIDTNLFYMDYYYPVYPCKVSLLFITSLFQSTSFNLMLKQNTHIQNDRNYVRFIHPYPMGTDECHSIFSAFFLAHTATQDGLALVDKLIAHNNFALYKHTKATHWLTQNYQQNGVRRCLFDLILAHSNLVNPVIEFMRLNPTIINLRFLSEPIVARKDASVHMPRLYYLSKNKAFLASVAQYLSLTEDDKQETVLKQFHQSLLTYKINSLTMTENTWNTMSALAHCYQGQLLFAHLLRQLPGLVKMLTIQDFQRPHDPLDPPGTEHTDLYLVLNLYLSQPILGNPHYLTNLLVANKTLHTFALNYAATMERNAKSALASFIERCEANGLNADAIPYFETTNHYSNRALVYLLNQSKLLPQFNAVLPNRRSVIEMAFKDTNFQNVFVNKLCEIVERMDANAIITLFNEIPLNTRVMLGIDEIPLLAYLLCLSERDTIITVLYTSDKSRHFCRGHLLSYWTKAFYTFAPDNPKSRFSHLDLLLLYPELSEIAKLVINARFNDFLKKCSQSNYWFDPLFTSHAQVTRIMLFLMNEKLHALFMMLLPEIELTPDQLNKVLEEKIPGKQQDQGDNLLTHLRGSDSGRQMLAQFSKVLRVGAVFADPLAPTMAAQPPRRFLERQGIFATPRAIVHEDEIPTMSAEDALSLIKQYTPPSK